ncbi:flagellar basal body-associated FliL family protein [Anaeropeptidivorans aminofermentans]|jgi:flagellar basal body-associated protein FliL|uniref:flagellar basal body-associated FliL family protein n=1 Tax=Anaeropeptidivorans aminofermentans TaxID=2934315 RepID=UPI0020244E0F|nr:flagellar basal body-associated FliL family protein [Anaeropeptidivorans aminofermentans]MBE6011943.1 flagellar basal body-associated FliL family protein [Lachnospiraceae bacterium]
MEKNKKMMIVIIALLVVLLAVIIGFAVFTFRMIGSNKSEAQEKVQMAPDTSILQSENVGFTTPLNVNLKKGADGAEHAISINVTIVMDSSGKDDGELITKIKDSEYIIRDVTLTVLRNKTIDEIRDEDSMDIIKQEILTRLQEEFKTNIIYKVYLDNYFSA